MHVVIPNEVLSGDISSSSLGVIEYQAWSPASTYAKGDYVDKDFKVYRSVVNNNQDDPDGFLEGANAEVPTWVFMGYSNYVRMITEGVDSISTQTSGSLTFTIQHGAGQLVETIALLNVSGTSVDITVTDPSEGVVYTASAEILDATSSDWWEFFFLPYTEKNDHIFTGIPPYAGTSITVTVNNDGISSDTSLGRYITGISKFIGDTDYSTTVGRKRYREYSRDGFGNLVITPRRNTKRASYQVTVQNSDIDKVQEMFDVIEDTPTLYIGTLESDTGFNESLNIFGVANDFDINIAYYSHSLCTIDVEGY